MTANGAGESKPILVGVSEAIRRVVQMIDTVAASDCPVLIEGESGTGKELVARRLHATSPRVVGPFIPVNCASITETLFESQFFGHVRGAFTGAEKEMLGLVRSAHGGTLFMDEVGEIPLALQPKLLRTLQDGEVLPVGVARPVKVDTRFVAAANRSLAQRVREGSFREDLYYRLDIVRIVLPPLRSHPEDVPVLLDCFCRRCSDRYRRDAIRISPAVCRRLMEHTWPGNVRELEAWVERVYATGLEPDVLAEQLLADHAGLEPPPPAGVMTLAQAERQAIVRAMAEADSKQQDAARLLQIHRATLARKLRRHRLG